MTVSTPVTRLRREPTGEKDRHNKAVMGPEVSTVLDQLCVFDAGTSDESIEVGRQPTVTAPRALFEEVADIKQSDRLEIHGEVFTVVGKPRWFDNGGRAKAFVVNLEASEG